VLTARKHDGRVRLVNPLKPSRLIAGVRADKNVARTLAENQNGPTLRLDYRAQSVFEYRPAHVGRSLYAQCRLVRDLVDVKALTLKPTGSCSDAVAVGAVMIVVGLKISSACGFR
jgi:hypothetical protein